MELQRSKADCKEPIIKVKPRHLMPLDPLVCPSPNAVSDARFRLEAVSVRTAPTPAISRGHERWVHIPSADIRSAANASSHTDEAYCRQVSETRRPEDGPDRERHRGAAWPPSILTVFAAGGYPNVQTHRQRTGLSLGNLDLPENSTDAGPQQHHPELQATE